jgi:hypothetical protein
MSVVSVAQAKQHLNITAGTSEAEIQAFIDSCEAAISRHVGPLSATATTVEVSGCGRALILPTTPAISLTTVTDYTGATVPTTDLRVTTDGIVTYKIGGTFTSPWYTVVYQAGRATVPDDLLLAVLELMRHKWMASQRGGKGNQVAMLANTLPGAAYTFPFAVTELMAPHIRVAV